ncbi:MAG TPA: transposase [Polyangiaceae bacterium]
MGRPGWLDSSWTSGSGRRFARCFCAKRAAGRPGKGDRNFIEAELWWRRTGVPWRDLPVEFGAWKTVWAKRGKWKDLFDALQTDRDDRRRASRGQVVASLVRLGVFPGALGDVQHNRQARPGEPIRQVASSSR